MRSHASGRICPESALPVIEDVAQGEGEPKCPLELPDKLIADRINSRSGTDEYSPMPAQLSFSESFSNAGQVRERLFSIKPETDMRSSILYLRDASFALFMFRAKQGILNSGSRDLIPLFQKLLESKLDKSLEQSLEGILNEIREAPVKGETAEITANRFKAGFCLLRAANVQPKNDM